MKRFRFRGGWTGAVAAACLLVVGGSSAFAADRAGKVELGAFLGAYRFDKDLDLKNGWAAGGRLGYFFTNNLAAELSADYAQSKDKENDDRKGIIQPHIDALYHLGNWGGLEPFVAAGVGTIRYQNPGADWDAMFNYGAGLKYWFADDVGLRLDVRHILNSNHMYGNVMGTIGLTWLFGGAQPVKAPAPPPPPPPPAAPTASISANPSEIEQGQASTLSWATTNANDVSIEGIGSVAPTGTRVVKPQGSASYRLVAKGPGGVAEAVTGVKVSAPAPAPVAPAPADSDNDGVPDSLDKCPGTPAGVAVDKDGCPLDSDKDGVPDYLDKCPGTPAGVKVDKDGCPLDSDKDGVPDYLDKCPGTPAGVKVDKDGCPLDSDGDGVPDYLDKCPNTPKGKKVDANGCPERKVVELLIHFDFDKYDVKPQYFGQIEAVAKFMKEYPKVNAVIEGHTDSIGTEEYNLKLSARRANAVAKILTQKYGISMERITAQSLGKTKPVASNDTAEGRAKNRRVYAVLESD